LESSRTVSPKAEAQKRLTQYGPNELEEKKTNLFLKFLSYFWGPIPWMIEVAVILFGRCPALAEVIYLPPSASGPHAVVGFWEEHTAGNASRPQSQLAINARVKRDGKWINPPARELVHR